MIPKVKNVYIFLDTLKMNFEIAKAAVEESTIIRMIETDVTLILLII
jgi:hypothetical protein